MAIDEYAHLSPAKLGELVRHLARSEQDARERLAARPNRKSWIRDRLARLREAFTGVLAARARRLRFALPR